ncbi:MAG: response regulator [bacterium]
MTKPESKTVLVVEDEPDVLMFIEAALEDAGFVVQTATNGHDAYKRVREKAPDFITLDLVMPKQSGALFYLKLRKNAQWKDIPVMVLSAHAHDELGEEDFKRLMKGKEAPRPQYFMEKPVNPTLLAALVCQALGVEGGPEVGEEAAEERGHVVRRLQNADLETLKRIKAVLNGEEQ